MTAENDQALRRADELLAAAANELARYDHASARRAQLASDLAAADERSRRLEVELTKERADVAKLSSGVRGFLYALLGDEQLSTEQREAVEAEARLAEAEASRGQLRAALRSLESTLAPHDRHELANADEAARTAKEELLVRLNHPAGRALQDLAVSVQALDIELVPLDDAVRAGEAALAKLQAVITTLDRALDERVEQADARGTAGEAEAAIALFQRAVDALGMAEDERLGFSTMIDADERLPFVDKWIRALVGKGDRLARLATARRAVADKHAIVQAQLARVRARRDELVPRRERWLEERRRLLG